MRVRADVLLPVAPEAAFDILARWEEQPRWMRDADRVDIVSEQRAGPGTRVAVRTRVLGIPLFTEVLEVVAWEPPRRIVVAHRSFVRGTGEWVLEPEAGGTRFAWTEELSLPIPAIGELALLAYRSIMRRLMRASLANLRALSSR